MEIRDGPPEAGPEHADSAAPSDHKDASSPTPALALSPIRSRILDALDAPMTPDALAEAVGIRPDQLRAEITMLEVLARVVRRGTHIERVAR